MLLALLDYRDYILQRGKYSPTSIERSGGRLMVAENFLGYEHLKPSTLFFMHTRTSTLSWSIMYFQSRHEDGNSVWSHVGTFTYDGYIIDVTTEGVIEHPFSDYFDGESYVRIVDFPVPEEDKRDEAVAWLRSQIGTPYGWDIVTYLGLRRLFGKDADYHPKFSVDILIVLAVVSLPGLRWKRWQHVIINIALAHIAAVIYNHPHREKERVLHERSASENRKRVTEMLSRDEARNQETDHG